MHARVFVRVRVRVSTVSNIATDQGALFHK